MLISANFFISNNILSEKISTYFWLIFKEQKFSIKKIRNIILDKRKTEKDFQKNSKVKGLYRKKQIGQSFNETDYNSFKFPMNRQSIAKEKEVAPVVTKKEADTKGNITSSNSILNFYRR